MKPNEDYDHYKEAGGSHGYPAVSQYNKSPSFIGEQITRSDVFRF
jgi:hypothetical protein